MKAPPFFTLGTVFLGVATSALGFLRGTSAEQEAGGGEERFGRHHPRHTFYCEHSATGDSVDQVLSGHITIFRPIVCETTQVRVRCSLRGCWVGLVAFLLGEPWRQAKNDAIAYTVQSIARAGVRVQTGGVSGVQRRCYMHAACLMIYLL